MKNILIITDFRPPKAGERFIVDNIITTAGCNFGEARKHFIVAAEVEVPSDAYGLQYYFVNKNGCTINQVGTSASTGRIDLSRPKVKKWVWERDFSLNDHFTLKTKKPMSEKELLKSEGCSVIVNWRKVPGSEIEVEE